MTRTARFDISPRRPGTMFPCVFTYATPEYREHVDRLRESMRRTNAGIDFIVYDRPTRNSWVGNCAQKADVFVEHVGKHRRPSLWVDADATVEADLIPFFVETWKAKADVAVCRPTPGRTWPRVQSRLLSGTVFVDGRVKVVEEIVRAWSQAAKKFPDALDQETLFETLAAFPAARVVDLDPRLVCIRDLMPDVVDPIIIHHQASRTMKDRIG